MDTLQYGIEISYEDVYNTVLNLVINGYPSILQAENKCAEYEALGFKPCYKWIPFNT